MTHISSWLRYHSVLFTILVTGIVFALYALPVLADDREDIAQLQRQVAALQEDLDSLAAAPSPTDRWQIYGSLRIGVGRLDDGDSGEINVFNRGSRIGVRGTYTPEGRMPEAFWQLESGVDVDAGDGTLASRDSFVGLRDHWGAVRVGFFASPARIVGRRTDQIHSRIGDNRNILRTDTLTGGQNGRANGWDNRIGNAIEYASPVAAGVQATILYSTHFDDSFGQTTATAPAVSASLSFERGPLWLAVAAETVDRDSEEVPGDEGDPSLYRLAAVYDLGRLEVSAIVQRAESQQGNDRWNRDSAGVGANYQLNDRIYIKGQVYRADNMDALADTDATMIAAELEYRLYPRTRFYFSLAHTNNGREAQFQSTRGVISDGPAGQDSTSASLVLRQDF